MLIFEIDYYYTLEEGEQHNNSSKWIKNKRNITLPFLTPNALSLPTLQNGINQQFNNWRIQIIRKISKISSIIISKSG